MKHILYVLSVIVAAIGFQAYSYAQYVADMPKLKEVKGKKLLEEITPLQHKNGLWGYANAEGKFRIKPVFSAVHPYEGSVARVNVDGRWGIISNAGLYVTPPKYDRLDQFSEDSVAIAIRGDDFMLISQKGDTLQNSIYDEILYADYGYISRLESKYGTIDRSGHKILDPQFDYIERLDRQRGLEHVLKDGKWGILKNGRELLTLKFDKKVTFLQEAISASLPDLYLAEIDGKKGVVTSYGQFVIPCVYDDISLSPSHTYYVTRVGSKYGAFSMKMNQLVAPILDEVPYIGEDVFKVFDNGTFYALNYNGSVEFKNCAELYQMFKPDEYVTTKSIPEWSKTSLIEENLMDFEERISEAAKVRDLLRQYSYNLKAAMEDDSMPKGFDLNIPAEEREKYGIMDGGSFQRASGILSDDKGNNLNIHYKAVSPMGYEVDFVSDPLTGEYYFIIYNERFSLRDALAKFNVKELSGVYPKDFALLSDKRLLVRLAFIRTAAECESSIFETDSLQLPVQSYEITVHKGLPNPKLETHAVVTFDFNQLSPISFAQIPHNSDDIMSGSCFGGFYIHSGKAVIVDPNNPLRRFDLNGIFDWEFYPRTGEKFYGLEETENFIYLCGSTINAATQGSEIPVIVQLTKRGKRNNEILSEQNQARFIDIVCKDHLIYTRTDFIKTKAFTNGYLPHFVLEDYSDNFGVGIKCVWEQWGGGIIGGCGLISDNGKWLYGPVLQDDDVCAAYDWELSSFTQDYLVFRHHGNYGVLCRDGNVVIEPKYEKLELLQNPYYAKAYYDGFYGVIDVTGKIVVPFEYDYVGRMCEDIIIVAKDGKYGCFDKNGQIVVPVEHEEIREYVDGMARIRMMGRFGFIDTKGNILVAPFSDEVENFSEGCTVVTIRNKVGMVTFDGNWIVSPIFDAGGSLSGGLAFMGNKDSYGYIDKSGEFVIPQKYSSATDFNTAYGIACVMHEGHWGVIDRSGAEIVPFAYDKVVVSDDGYILAEKGGKCGIYASSGKLVYPIECDSVEIGKNRKMFKCGVAVARINGVRVQIDDLGNLVWQYPTLTEAL